MVFPESITSLSCAAAIVLYLTACSTLPQSPHAHQSAYVKSNTLSTANPVYNPGLAQQKLTTYYRSWRGTPHKLGGNTRSGIDCSGFTHVVYREVFNMRIPRSTELLAKSGHYIDRSNLVPGDLVFFKTGIKQRHVGIYIGNGKFIHVSSTKGVMESRLNSPYWSKHYWKTKRILTPR